MKIKKWLISLFLLLTLIFLGLYLALPKIGQTLLVRYGYSNLQIKTVDYTPPFGLEIKLSDPEFQIPDYTEYLAPMKLDADIQLGLSSNANFIARLSDKNGAFVFKTQGQHNFISGTGHTDFTLSEITFEPGIRKPSQFFPVAKKHLQEVSGKIAASGNLTWGHKLNGTAEILATNLSGKIANTEIRDLNSVIKLASIQPLTTEKDQIAYIGALNTGLPLTNGFMRFTLKPDDKLAVSEFKWRFAGGQLFADPFEIDIEKRNTTIVLKAQTLDLKQIFDMAALEGLNATGLVQGRLPITLKDSQISVADGALSALSPGTIRYKPDNPPAFLLQKGTGVGTLREALKNFHFNDLNLKIDGETGGNQKISLQAKGNNPDFQGGFPVNINLNLEGALDSLLKQNLGNYKMPDVVRKQIEAYEEKHAQ